MYILIDTEDKFYETLPEIEAYSQTKNCKFAIDCETYSFYNPEVQDGLYKVPRPIRITPRMISPLTTKTPLRIEFEGLIATFQLGADPRILDRQWIFDLKKLPKDLIIEHIKPLLLNKIIIGHNLKYDIGFLITQLDIWLTPDKLRDTMLIDQLLISGRKDKVGLIDNYRRYLDYGFFIAETGKTVYEYSDFKEGWQSAYWGVDQYPKAQLQYSADDVRLIFYVYEAQKEAIKKFTKKFPRNKLIDRIKAEGELITEIALMELRGIRIDLEYHRTQVIPFLEQQLKEAQDKANSLCPNPNPILTKGRGVNKRPYQPPINFNSSTQVPKILKELGIKVPNAQEKTLKKIRYRHPAVEWILRVKKASTLLNNFGYKLLRFTHEDGKIYPNFRQIGTETGRFSANSPNLQQVPAKGKLFGKIKASELCRRSFICDPETILGIADYSNIQPRIIAELTQAVKLIDAFKRGVDYHGFTAQLLLDLPEPPKKGSIEREEVGKIGNLSLAFCAGWPNLQENIYVFTLDNEVPTRWSDQEAKERFEKYFQEMPEVRVKQNAIRAAVEKALEPHNSLADFAGRKPIFTISTELKKGKEVAFGRHRSFYLTGPQEEMAKVRVKGDPREHPLHRWYKATHEKPIKDEDGNDTDEVTVTTNYYNEFNKTISNIAREAYNYLIQAEEANIMKLAIVLTGQKFRNAGFDPLTEGLCLTIHDEVVFQVKKEHGELAKNLLVEAMTEAAKTVIVSLECPIDSTLDTSWAKPESEKAPAQV